MRIINVIEVQDDIVVTISTFEETPANLKKAEDLFRKIASDMEPRMSEDTLEICVQDGYLTTSNKAVYITWSELQ